MYLGATMRDNTALDCYMREKHISVWFELPYFGVSLLQYFNLYLN